LVYNISAGGSYKKKETILSAIENIDKWGFSTLITK